MEKPNYYSVIPAEIRYDKELTANSKLLYGEITSLCNEKGICWASNKYFSDLYGVSKETISRWISQLANKQYIFVKMFYKENSKEIDKRIISINKLKEIPPIDKNDNTYCENYEGNNVLPKINIPYCQKSNGGSDENIKENITSINNKEKEEELKKIIKFYEDNITLITPFVSEDMEKYLQDGLDADLIITCMKEAVSRNKRNWRYIVSILNDCCNNNIKTTNQFNIKQNEFKSNNKSTNRVKQKIEYSEMEFTDEEEYKKRILEKG